jgi:hypothetical protein
MIRTARIKERAPVLKEIVRRRRPGRASKQVSRLTISLFFPHTKADTLSRLQSQSLSQAPSHGHSHCHLHIQMQAHTSTETGTSNNFRESASFHNLRRVIASWQGIPYSTPKTRNRPVNRVLTNKAKPFALNRIYRPSFGLGRLKVIEPSCCRRM